MSKKTIAAIAFLACLVLGGTIYRVFFVWFASVPTGAMMNTILIGDRLMFTRSFFEIERGRVVVFQYPNDPLWYVARVIGLPGESIQIRGGRVLINGSELPEQKVFARERDSSFDQLEEVSTEGSGPYKVFYTRPRRSEALLDEVAPIASDAPLRLNVDEYFLMEDNRDNSEDSRYRGPVRRDRIWGTASLVYYSAFVGESGEEHVRSDRIFHRIK